MASIRGVAGGSTTAKKATPRSMLTPSTLSRVPVAATTGTGGAATGVVAAASSSPSTGRSMSSASWTGATGATGASASGLASALGCRIRTPEWRATSSGGASGCAFARPGCWMGGGGSSRLGRAGPNDRAASSGSSGGGFGGIRASLRQPPGGCGADRQRRGQR